LLALAYVIYTNMIDPKVGQPSVIAAGGIIVVSTLYYFLVLRRRGPWILQGPVS
jgi:hypothetical protein